MDKFWERYIQSRPANSKGAFDAFAAAHKEPRITAQEPRIGLKPGGIVEPGVTHYANPGGRPKIEIKDWTLETKANLETWMDNTGSTVKDYNKLPDSQKNAIKYGKVTGIKQVAGAFGKLREGPKTKEFRNWLSKQDPKTLTGDSVDDLIKQSKIKTTSTHQRSGLVNAINKIVQEKEFAKFKNITLGRKYPSVRVDKFADAILDAYTKDDITKIAGKYRSDVHRVKNNIFGNLDQLIKKTGLSEETIFDLLDDREAFQDLEMQGERGLVVAPDKSKFYKQAENWIVKNSKRYEDPDKLKKAFTRTFGKDNHLIQIINKGTSTSIPFSEWFKKNIMGALGPTYSSTQLDNIFKTAIYTNNENVRGKIVDELTKVIPEGGTKKFPGKRTLDINKILNESPLLKKFGLNQEIKGPIARLLAKEVGEDLLKQIARLRRPWLGTFELINYLKDRVSPKYKSMFEEAANAVRHAQKTQWPEAKKALNLSQSIMFDHKVPKALMKLGYADEIEYIKLNPTSADFNSKIKRIQFDMPMVRLVHQWEKAQTLDAKSKAVGEMNTLKDKFSKKYGNYLDDVKINVDKTGKPIFSSKTPVVAKKTDLVKSLETSLQHEKFPTMSKATQAKFLQLMKTAKTAKGPAKFKAMQAIITTVGTAAAASLFDKFGIQPAMADTGVAAPGVTAGDIGLGALATAVPKKGRKLWGKALSGASKILSTTPGFLGLEAFIGPGFVSSAGGSFGEAIASPFLLEGTMRDKRIYDQLKKEGYSEDQIQVVKDSVMLRADVGDTGLHTSMIPLQEIEYKGKKFTAGDTELADIASIYDKAAGVIAEEDEARLERADKFDYLQDTGFATGGLANLTRTVARDSGPMQGLASTPEYATYRKEYKWQT